MKSPEEWTEALTAIFHGWDDYMPDYHPSPDIIAIVEAIRAEQRKASWLSVMDNADSIEIYGMGLDGEPYYRERSVREAILTPGKEKSDDRP